MALRMSPQEAQAKWASRTAAASTDYAAGIDRVTQAPGQAAVAQSQAYLNGVQSNIEKWKRNTARVSLESWKAAAKGIGAQRLASGVQAKQDKWGSFAAEFFPHLDRGVATVKAMPKDTFEARVQRSVAMMQHNRTFKRSSS